MQEPSKLNTDSAVPRQEDAPPLENRETAEASSNGGGTQWKESDILETLPKNPFTGEDFLYRQDEEGAGVYSDVGDGQDLWHVKRKRPDDG